MEEQQTGSNASKQTLAGAVSGGQMAGPQGGSQVGMPPQPGGMKPPGMPPMPAPVPGKAKKGPGIGFWIVGLVVLIGLGAGGYYAWSQGWVGEFKDMLAKVTSPTDAGMETDSTGEAMVEQPEEENSTMTELTVTEEPVDIPEGWIVEETSCGALIARPSDWKLRKQCLGDDDQTDCLISNDFVGRLAVNDYQVTQGLVMLLSCEPLAEGVTPTTTGLIDDCKQRIALDVQETNLCEQFTAGSKAFVVYKAGDYQLARGNERYKVQVLPPPPTAFMLVRQVLGTFQIKQGTMQQEMKIDESSPMMDEATGSAVSGTGVTVN